MKKLFTNLFVILLTVLAVACAKQEAAPGVGGSGTQAYVPSQCVPDQFGNLPPGCPVPSTASTNLSGDLLLASESATVPLLKDLPGRLQRPWTQFSSMSGFTPLYRCGTGMSTCINECNNFRYGAQIHINVYSGNGTVDFKAGPYKSPGLCSSSYDNSQYVINIPVWVYSTNGNKGFAFRSAQTYPFNKAFSIEVDEGVLTSTQTTTFWGKVFYNNALIGNVQLYRHN